MDKITKNQLCQPAFISLILCIPALYIKELFIFSWLGLFPLFLAAFKLDTHPLYMARQATLFGIFYYGVALTWLWSFSPFHYFSFLFFVCFIWMVYFMAIYYAWKASRNILFRISVGAILWVIYYLIFYFSPWGTFIVETLFWGPLSLMQTRSISSGLHIWGASLIALNIALGGWWLQKSTCRSITLAGTCLLIGILSLWSIQKSQQPSPPIPIKNIALIQHNLPIDERRFKQENFNWKTYEELGSQAVAQGAKLIVFPLYSLEPDTFRNPKRIQKLADQWNTPIIMGLHVPEKNGGSAFKLEPYYAAALYFTPGESTPEIYRAVEKAPLNNQYETTTDKYVLLKTPIGNLGILLCYEDALPRIAKAAKEAGADILISLNNPSHFMGTELLDYHVQQDQYRAIETGLWLLRLSPNGYSAVIDPNGNIIEKSNLGKEEILSLNQPI